MIKHKLVLIGAASLLCLTMGACGNQNNEANQSASESREASSLKKDNARLKKQIAKSKKHATSSASDNQDNASEQVSSSSQQATSSAQQSSTKVNNAQDALNAARAKYGDGNGNYHWTVMYDADTGQPIRNADGSYFVKAIDPTQGTMTGTAQSVNVYPDGSMTNN